MTRGVCLFQAVCCHSPVTSACAFPSWLCSMGRTDSSWARNSFREGLSTGKWLPEQGTCLFCWALRACFYLPLKAANAWLPFLPPRSSSFSTDYANSSSSAHGSTSTTAPQPLKRSLQPKATVVSHAGETQIQPSQLLPLTST